MRPTKDEVFLNLALELARLSTCRRRRVGCVLTDASHEILALGYNGVASGQPHCLAHPCAGSTAPSGASLDACLAIHAEENALIRCRDFKAIHTAYCSTAPCIGCTKKLLNTGCLRVVFREPYPHSEAENLWLRTGREWLHKNY